VATKLKDQTAPPVPSQSADNGRTKISRDEAMAVITAEQQAKSQQFDTRYRELCLELGICLQPYATLSEDGRVVCALRKIPIDIGERG
jgi:hypothetical protein